MICAHLACFSRVFSQESLPNKWTGCNECGERVKGQAGLTCGQDDPPCPQKLELQTLMTGAKGQEHGNT